MILTILGARPQFIKAAVVSKALAQMGITENIIHTGQHYDSRMSSIFWEELEMLPYKINLNIGSGTHGAQTAQMILRIEQYILDLPEKPSAILVYGDTNSTLAGALVASKLLIRLIHIESGLRSFNRSMPEEVNRIVTDHLSDILFCSSESGIRQLEIEGIKNNVFCSGDVMFDAVNTFLPIAKKRSCFFEENPSLKQIPYSILTLHRPSNVDNVEQLHSILENIGKISDCIVWPVHPRTRDKLNSVLIPKNILLIPPLSYFEMLTALLGSQKVLTDSGGLQKEAYWLKKPCITIRTETEWVETIENGWNTLINNNSTLLEVYNSFVDETSWQPLYGDGSAAQYIAKVLKSLI